MDERDIEIGLLGPLQVRCAGEPVALPGRRRSLLGMLALRPGAPVTVDRLVDGLWGEAAPGTAVRTLHSHIAKLGASLHRDGRERPIRRRDPGYLLDRERAGIDHERFGELAARGLRHAKRGRYTEAVRAYESGLALWRAASALTDCGLHGWVLAEATALEDLRLDVTEELFAARLIGGGPAAGTVGEIELMARRHPLRERLWELLMAALQADGRTGEALAAYQRARETLVEELGVEPSAGLQHVHAAVLHGTADPAALLRLAPAVVSGGSAAGPAALPRPLTTLVGRSAETAAIAALLGTARLVTLTGFGGSGKTRLAVEVAGAVSEDFDEVAFADLSALRYPEFVAVTLADALGARGRPGTPLPDLPADRIGTDPVLVVLDNCEHRVVECARIARALLTRCPNLRVLATSQMALQVPGEAVELVPGLRTPDPGLVHNAADLAGYDAVALFADRARIRRVEALSPKDARAVAAICARCEGLPLAIELAAARTRVLTLPEIADRFRDRFELLADGPRTSRGRHRALRTTVEWSYGLLTGDERDLLRRIGLLPGAFSLQTAEAVCPGMPVLALLDRLVARSLLKAVPTETGMRYHLSETIRDYVARLLLAGPDEAARAHPLAVLP